MDNCNIYIIKKKKKENILLLGKTSVPNPSSMNNFYNYIRLQAEITFKCSCWISGLELG